MRWSQWCNSGGPGRLLRPARPRRWGCFLPLRGVFRNVRCALCSQIPSRSAVCASVALNGIPVPNGSESRGRDPPELSYFCLRNYSTYSSCPGLSFFGFPPVLDHGMICASARRETRRNAFFLLPSVKHCFPPENIIFDDSRFLELLTKK